MDWVRSVITKHYSYLSTVSFTVLSFICIEITFPFRYRSSTSA